MIQPISTVLLGDIAAGKGTQAGLIAKKFRLHLIDTGAYSRKVLTGKTKVSRRLARIKLGKLAPSDIIQNYLKAEISKLKRNEGVLIDGGKMPAEASLIYHLFKKQGRRPLVISLHIPKAEIFRRLRWRFYCSKTGEPLVLKTGKLICPKHGDKVIKRADDDPKAIRNRIAYYDRVYSQTVKFWQSKGYLKKINGKKSVSEVTKDIVQTIMNYGFD